MLPKPCFPKRPLKVAVLGATGAVGTEIIKILDERSFPIGHLLPLASRKSAGNLQKWKNETIKIEEVNAKSFNGIDLVLASAGGSISKAWKNVILESGALLIDNSSAFRMDQGVPLVVPEVNPNDAFQHQGLIANPNCTTILLSLVLAPLTAEIPINRVIVSTYQSASGAGAMAMEELKQLSKAFLEGREEQSQVLPYSLAFNLFLHNSPLQENNYCEEEMKMANETRKIMGIPNLNFSATCVRVPVLRAHSESINIEFSKPFEVENARQILNSSPGIKLLEEFENNRFPMPTDVTGKDDVMVGRIRQDISHPNAIELWLCGDQIRKGAALNAIQIAELFLPKS